MQLEDEVFEFEFEAFAPKEMDFHSIKQYLVQYLDRGLFNASELADIVLALGAGGVGSTMKVGGEQEDALGFISLVPIRPNQVIYFWCHKNRKRNVFNN